LDLKFVGYAADPLQQVFVEWEPAATASNSPGLYAWRDGKGGMRHTPAHIDVTLYFKILCVTSAYLCARPNPVPWTPFSGSEIFSKAPISTVDTGRMSMQIKVLHTQTAQKELAQKPECNQRRYH
jgi:hypothetical protein